MGEMSSSNPVTRIDVCKVHFCQTTDQFKLYISLCLFFNFSPVTMVFSCSGQVWAQFHFIRIGKMSCFGLKYMFYSPQTHLGVLSKNIQSLYSYKSFNKHGTFCGNLLQPMTCTNLNVSVVCSNVNWQHFVLETEQLLHLPFHERIKLVVL